MTLKKNDDVDLLSAILSMQRDEKIEEDILTTSLHQDLDHLIQTIRQHFGMDTAFLSRFHHGQREILHVDNRVSCTSSLQKDHKDKNEETYCRLIADKKLPNIIPDTSKNKLTKDLVITKNLNIGSYIGVPISLSDNSIYGTLCCFSERVDKSLSNKDLSLLTLFAKFAARNIEKELNASKAQQVAREDIFDIINKKQLKVVLQPIYDFRAKSIKGVECLSRF